MTISRHSAPESKRSQMMRAVRQKNTSAERLVRGILQKLGVRFRVNHPGLPGHPDFANRARGWAIFVHGCFWHGHRNCRKTRGGESGRVPATNSEWWSEKLRSNRERDARKELALRDAGLRVLTIWECELKDLSEVEARVRRFLDRPSE